MKQLLLALAVLAAPAAIAADAPLRNPIEVPYIGFKAVVDDGRVVSTWKRYRRDDFISYRLVKSDSDAAPVFPATKAIYTTVAPGDTMFEDGLLTAGTWRYRLCIVTRYGDRWVSPVVTVVIGADQVKRSAPTVADFE
jgi:opacity protein-like surface antigen